MELCNAGDLERLKEARGRFSETEARIILQQLVSGFKEIYKQEVMHRDVKLANILVHLPNENFDQINKIANPVQRKNAMKEKLKTLDLVKSGLLVKIADLGFARTLKAPVGYDEEGELAKTMCGTPLVMAPEVLHGKQYNHKADVWSLGIIMFEMLTGFTPFTGYNRDDLARNLNKGTYKLPKEL